MKSLSKLLFVLLVLLLCVGGLYIFVLQVGRVSVDKLLVQVDEKIEDRQYTEGKKLLRSSRSLNLSRHNWLRVIKRAYVISKITSDYTVLESVAQKACKSLPGAEEFWAFYTMALLKQNRYAEALVAAENLDSEQFSSLRGEALLSDLHASEESPLAYAEKTLTVAADASYFQKVAQDLKSPVLFYDAAILWLREGLPERALAILPWIGIGGQTSAIGRAMIAYDSGDINRAVQELGKIDRNLKTTFDPVFLSANLNLATGHYRNAYLGYNQAIRLNRKGDWRVYQNLAILSWENNDKRQAIQFLRNGLDSFPLQKNLIMTYGYYVNNTAEVKALVSQYLLRHPLDPEMSIYNLFFFKNQLPPEHQRTDLWTLFNSNLTSKALASYMIWFFLSNMNIQDATLTLDRYARAGGDPSWVNFYRGFINIRENNFDAALQNFSEPTPNGWEGAYNQGLIYLYLQDYNAAFESFTRAEKAFYLKSNANRYPANLASIYSQLALTSLQNKKPALARTIAERALSINKENVLAQRVLRETSI